MFMFARQIRQTTDFARNTPGRLAGVTLPAFAATDDTTLVAARDRAEKSMAFATSITAISWTAGGTQRTMKGRAHRLHFCLPNFYFHTTTADNIVRQRGIEIGKRDFLGTC